MRGWLPALALAVCACSSDRSNDVVFGAAGPWNKAYGKTDSAGIELAVAEINLRPAWKAHPLVIRFKNDSGTGQGATPVARSFVMDPAVSAVIGHINSGAMVAAARIYDGALPAVATAATSPALTGISPWAFRIASSDVANGRTIAEYIAGKDVKRVAIVYENNSYGRGLADAFRQYMVAHNIEVVSADPIDENDGQNLEPFVSFFVKKDVDAVFAATNDPASSNFLQEARRQHLSSTLVGGDGWMTVGANPKSEGVLVGAPFTAADSRQRVQAFVVAYKQRFGVEPDGFAALAYDATMLLAQAVERVGTDRKAIRDYLAALPTPYEGVTGNIRFGADGDPQGKSIFITRFERGTLRMVGGR